MTSSFLKSIVKEIDNDYAGLLSEGGVGDIESFVDTGSYIFNALVSGSIYGGVPSNKITAIAGESGTGKTFFCMGIVQNYLKENPDAGVVFALYSPLTGDVTKFVRVEKEKNNRVKLAEVDADGNDLPGGEGDAPEETEEFRGFPTYKQPSKPNIFKQLKPQEAFDIDEPQA